MLRQRDGRVAGSNLSTGELFAARCCCGIDVRNPGEQGREAGYFDLVPGHGYLVKVTLMVSERQQQANKRTAAKLFLY